MKNSPSSLAIVGLISGLILLMSHVGESNYIGIGLPIPAMYPPPAMSPPLRVGFYNGRCGNFDVQAFIEYRFEEFFRNNPYILPAFLRLQFHDCWVNGCDASITIEGYSTERTAGPNLSVRGFEEIEAVKDIVERICPEVVSCADIIAIATKVVIKLGGGLDYPVQTGRRDGLRSVDTDTKQLPGPSMSVIDTFTNFAGKGFTLEEMVLLIGGGHTVGITHCSFFKRRLYNDTSSYDSNMDEDFRREMIELCPNTDTYNDTVPDNAVWLDQNPWSTNTVDNSFYQQITFQRGVLPIDQALARDPLTENIVYKYASNATLFNEEFVKVMVKLQALDVLTGYQGEIRKECSRFN